MITVHHLENSRSQRILWLLEELQLPYELVLHRRDARTLLAPPGLRAIHPLGKAPVIVDDGIVVAESGAIIEHLLERHAPAWGAQAPGALAGVPPGDSQLRRDYRYWMHYVEGSLMPVLVMTLLFGAIPRQPMPFLVRPVARGLCGKVQETFLDPRLEENGRWIDASLEGREWLLGSILSGADIQMSFAALALARRWKAAPPAPRLLAYVQRIEARPGWQRALARGGPLELLG